MSDRIKSATADLMAELADAQATVEKTTAALAALGAKPGAKPVATRKRARRDDRPLEDRMREAFASQTEPTAAGKLAPALHVSPKQAAQAAEQLAEQGALRRAATNRRGSTLYEAA